jgi:hypothetical protein
MVKFTFREKCDIFANPDCQILDSLASIAEFNPSRVGKKLLIRDSKTLFSQGGSMRRLEEAALAFAAASHEAFVLPVNSSVFLQSFSDSTEELTNYPWHRDDEHLPEMPLKADPERINSLGRDIARCLSEKGISVATVRATVVPVRAFNRALAESTNKATATFGIIRGLIGDLWQTSADDEDLLIRVDKQGGRDNYLPVLEGCVDGATFQSVVEGSEESRYVLEKGDRRMVVHFALRSDAAFLPVTLAGIVAKYTRELLMTRQNAWFSAREPGLEPTAGYPLDARRWLRDSLAVRKRLGIDDAILIRNR